MPSERYYFAGELIPAEEIRLQNEEFHHLAHVMRIKIGEEIEIINGRGDLAHAAVKQISKREAVLILQDKHAEPPPSFEIILAQAIPRINRLDTIVEKGTELGITQLWLFPGARSERRNLTDSQHERVKSIVISAAKQCGRLWLPEIYLKPKLAEWNAVKYPLYFGDTEPKAEYLMSVWQKHLPKDGVIILIGPEGGLADDEEKKLISMNAKGVKLHRYTLRTDTAGLAALSILSQFDTKA